MKILQLNVWSFRLEKLVIDFCLNQKPDVICFQEVTSIEGGAGCYFGTLEEFNEALRYPYSYFSPALEFSFMRRTVQFGNVILSRLPFSTTETLQTRNQLTKDFDVISDDYNVRNLQHVMLSTGGGRLHILNHHGYQIADHKYGDEETLRQCALIRDYVKKLSGEVVLAGDFNLEPRSPSLQLLNNTLRNLCIEHKITTTRTPLSSKREVCDYIFVNDKVTLKKFEAANELLADHKALLIEI